jgi:hypothetical protein
MLADLAAKIDHQLKEVAADAGPRMRGSHAGDRHMLGKQRRAISRATGEGADGFIARFRRAAWNDLCETGGHLHSLRSRWLDPKKPEVVRSICALLAGMGVSGNLVPVLVVPLLVIILHIGVTAFCQSPNGGGRKIKRATTNDISR